jgi:predicted RNase H-like HicB family nuclease
MAQTEYLVIVEKYESGTFGAYVPELPGIGVAGETEDEVRDLVGEAIRLYLDELDRGDDRGSASVVVSHYTVAV